MALHNHYFRPFVSDDLPLMRRWLEMPHNRAWWGDPDTELAYIRDMIEGRDTTKPFIFSVDVAPTGIFSQAVTPTGYIQYWFISHHQNATWIADHPWLAELPSDAVGVDLLIGEPHLLSKGIGSGTLNSFAEFLVEDHPTIIVDPDPANARAVRAYEKAGFKPITQLLGRTGDTLIMHFDPQYDLNETETKQ